MVIPVDVPRDKTDRVQMKSMLEYSRKPIIAVSFSSQGTSKIVQMAEIVAGGLPKLQEKPFVIHYVQPVRSLFHNEDSVEKLFITARKGLPLLYLVSAIMGISSPITAAGYQVMGGAGQLAALVLTQLVREGTPFIGRGGRVVEADMKTMLATFANPGNRIFPADMAHYYNFPSFGVAGATDSKALDWQAVSEVSLTLMADSLVGANLIHDAGYIESGVTYSAEMLVLCNEIISWIRHFKRGAPVNEETMALELIQQFGFSSDFLSTEHTMKHFREQWEPELFDRNSYNGWQKRGGLETSAKVKQRLESLLEEMPLSRLSPGVLKELEAIIES
jgi:trimethylamine--corrinoid protein Co-methyltransferase